MLVKSKELHHLPAFYQSKNIAYISSISDCVRPSTIFGSLMISSKWLANSPLLIEYNVNSADIDLTLLPISFNFANGMTYGVYATVSANSLSTDVRLDANVFLLLVLFSLVNHSNSLHSYGKCSYPVEPVEVFTNRWSHSFYMSKSTFLVFDKPCLKWSVKNCTGVLLQLSPMYLT